MAAVIAVMGFDWRHVIRSILRIGFMEVTSVHLIMPPWSDERAEAGVAEVRKLAKAAGLSEGSVLVHRVDPRGFIQAVATITDIIASALAAEERALISLGGGMRALVVETFLAALSVYSSTGRAVEFVVDLEGREESVVFSAEDALLFRRGGPGRRDKAILEMARERGTISPKDLSEAMGIPRSTAHAILASLERRGFLRKVRRGKYSLTPLGEAFLTSSGA